MTGLALDSEKDLLSSLRKIFYEMRDLPAHESIKGCGPAVLQMMSNNRHDAALDMAKEALTSVPYSEVPECWRRLYEDAALHLARKALPVSKGVKRDSSGRIVAASQASSAEVKLSPTKVSPTKASTPKALPTDPLADILGDIPDWIRDLIARLDKLAIMTGAPGRRRLLERLFGSVQIHIDRRGVDQLYSSGEAKRCIDRLYKNQKSVRPVLTMSRAIAVWHIGYGQSPLARFQQHLERDRSPVVLSGLICHWPACEKWTDLSYIYRHMMYGLRVLPVEIGRSYNDTSWTQKLMSFEEFLRNHIFPQHPETMGYIAQHDLANQIPSMRNELQFLDLSYCEPSMVNPPNIKTPPEHLEQPIRNTWFGPAGTISPLHTDPYHNLFCQITGSKYVRLYAPEETDKLYPQGTNENGIDMSNNSQVDIHQARQLEREIDGSTNLWHADDLDEEKKKQRRAFLRKFPRFEHAQFVECILEAGDCLYIPVGWWHYVESLETSFNVSFWFN